MKAFILSLLVVVVALAQKPGTQNQILGFSGPGRSVVTTTGAQTPGAVVAIDANGNHVAAPGVGIDASGNLSVGGALAGARVSVNRIANGAIALHSIVKGVAGGKVGPVASDSEAILGVAENVTTTDGDAVVVTELGPTTILCESGTDLNYLVAGTDPTKVKDSGYSTLSSISLTTRIVAKAWGPARAE